MFESKIAKLSFSFAPTNKDTDNTYTHNIFFGWNIKFAFKIIIYWIYQNEWRNKISSGKKRENNCGKTYWTCFLIKILANNEKMNTIDLSYFFTKNFLFSSTRNAFFFFVKFYILKSMLNFKFKQRTNTHKHSRRIRNLKKKKCFHWDWLYFISKEKTIVTIACLKMTEKSFFYSKITLTDDISSKLLLKCIYVNEFNCTQNYIKNHSEQSEKMYTNTYDIRTALFINQLIYLFMKYHKMTEYLLRNGYITSAVI